MSDFQPEGSTQRYDCGCVLTVRPDDGADTRTVVLSTCSIDCRVVQRILIIADELDIDTTMRRHPEPQYDDVMLAAAKRRKPCVVTDEAGQIVTAGTLVAWRGRIGYRARVNDGYVTRSYSLKTYNIELEKSP